MLTQKVLGMLHKCKLLFQQGKESRRTVQCNRLISGRAGHNPWVLDTNPELTGGKGFADGEWEFLTGNLEICKLGKSLENQHNF